MNASKEEAKKAKEVVDEIRLNIDLTQKGYNCWPDIIVGLDKIESFIEATERKLPSEKSYEREKQRKRTKKAE